MTDKRRKILEIMAEDGGYMSPTMVGQLAGYNYYSASSWASNGIGPLAHGGLVERAPGPDAQYCITQKGMEALKQEREAEEDELWRE